jgi:hypothetical protein
MPVKTGIQELRGFLDTGLRRYDGWKFGYSFLLTPNTWDGHNEA